jgi:hypothetical protein
VTRGIAALCLLFAASHAWAQIPAERPDDLQTPAERTDDFRRDPPETRQERRERIREERRERIEEAREERRERIARWRENVGGDGVHLRIFRSYTLAEGETTNEPVVVIGGSARIDGRVDDDVVVIGGGLHVGSMGVVTGNAVSLGGAVTLEPGASVQGSIDEAVMPWPTITFDPDWTSAWWAGAAFWGSIVRLLLTMAVAMLLTLMAPGWIGAISGRAGGASILPGLAVEVLFVPALVILIVVLTVSIVGIPLLAGIPLLLAGFAFIWLAGFTGVAVRVGQALRGRRALMQPLVADFLVGYTIIVAITVIGQLMAVGLGWLSPVSWPMRSAGLIVEYVAWTIGLGAAVTTLMTPQRIVPPPVPV